MAHDIPGDDPARDSFSSMQTLRPVAPPTVRSDSPTEVQMPRRSDGPRLDARFGGEGFAERYRREGTIGEGGMGEVRLCADARIGREVAMKVARPDPNGSHADAQMRFLREACVQGQLEHPSVVPVYDLGRDPAGALYFTMKRVRGLTVEEILARLARGDAEARHKFSRRKLLTSFASVCLAVDFAHARGVLHRDLKPANIMLGDFGEVYVLDWGLAKLAAGDDATIDPATPRPQTPPGAEVGRTEQGATMGTAGYMAPEQARGEVESLGPRTDVYALGSILFELLTLQPLHERKSVLELIASTLAGVDARPSHRVPLAEVPPELEAICVRATQLEPADRLASAREIAEAIDRFLDGDRDLALRRELALRHAGAAQAAAERAFATDSVDARKEALREVGQALALDPNHGAAKRTLIRVLTEPPRQLPPEAAAESEEIARQEQRTGAHAGMLIYLSWILYVPLSMWMGVKSWWGILPGLSFVGAAVECWRIARNPTGKLPLGLILWSTVAIATCSSEFGPFIAVPGMAATSAMTHMMKRGLASRVIIIALTSAAFLGPLLLEWVGIVPPSYAFRDGAIAILPRALNFTPLPTTLMLLLWNLQIVVIASVLVAQNRNVILRAERRLQLNAWQLKQLLPEDAHGVSAPSLPSEPGCSIL